MARYRKKPVVIEAFRLGEDVCEQWFRDEAKLGRVKLYAKDGWPYAGGNEFSIWAASIETLEGTMTAIAGDWIIRGTKGELYPCEHEIFRQCYEYDASEEHK
jgi:hypothetical protein